MEQVITYMMSRQVKKFYGNKTIDVIKLIVIL